MLHNNRRATRAVGATLRFSSCLYASLDLLKQRPATSLIGRLIDPKEIGDIVAFVCSARASVINGSCIRAEGGLLRTIG